MAEDAASRRYGPAAELTVLHLSDPQFGRQHGPGGYGLTGPGTRCSPGCMRISAGWRPTPASPRTSSSSRAT